jgi:H+/Cl- antiporter ClcA
MTLLQVMVRVRSNRLVRWTGFVVVSGVVGLYAVGTELYGSVVQRLRGPFFDYVAEHVRPRLSDDTTVAEEQIDFYLAWLLVGISLAILWAVFRKVRRHRLASDSHLA